jgi:hypothetical protein
MPQADPIAIALQAFEPGFSGQTWSKVQVLIIGMLLARGRRTVGRLPPPDGPTRVASTQPRPSRPQLRAGRPLDLSRHLLHLLVRTFASVCGDLTDVIGGALERRWGRRINLRGDLSSCACIQRVPLGLCQRAAVGRLDHARHSSLDAVALGVARVERSHPVS